MTHQIWDEQLKRMSQQGGSPIMLAEVLIRVALANRPVPRSAISKGGMLFRPAALAVGTVKKAADGLVGEDLLVEEGTTTGGQPGPPATPLRLGDKWAIIGIHIDQQHDGPDALAGIICGLDRKPLTRLVPGEVPRKGDEHDLRRLAEEIHKLTEKLLEELDEPAQVPGRRGRDRRARLARDSRGLRTRGLEPEGGSPEDPGRGTRATSPSCRESPALPKTTSTRWPSTATTSALSE